MVRRRPKPADPHRRIVGILAVLGLGFLAIAGQLLNLQVLEGERHAQLSDKNRLRVRPVAAPRGILFDRAGLIPLWFVVADQLEIGHSILIMALQGADFTPASDFLRADANSSPLFHCGIARA